MVTSLSSLTVEAHRRPLGCHCWMATSRGLRGGAEVTTAKTESCMSENSTSIGRGLDARPSGNSTWASQISPARVVVINCVAGAVVLGDVAGGKAIPCFRRQIILVGQEYDDSSP